MKTRKLTEIEKSIVLGHADYSWFSQVTSPCSVRLKVAEALWNYTAMDCNDTELAYGIDGLALYLDSVTVEVE